MTGLHILVVDDDPTISEVIAEALGDDGFSVDVAGSGEVALQKMRAKRPSAVVLDLMMPRMDGWTFLERCLAEANCNPDRVVVLSAARMTPGRDLPAVAAFLPKPFELRVLLETVESVAERP